MTGSAVNGLVPADCALGVATGGYEAEGGFNRPGEPANNWGRWERAGLVAPSGLACDFWRRPEEALDRAAGLGCDVLGLPVEWARIEPEDGEIDGSALDRYAEILAMCHDRGLAPVVTLHRLTHPWWLGEEYWLTPGSPDRFAEHVARTVDRLGERCSRWVTVHEPNVGAVAGWLSGRHPPGRFGAVSDAWAVLDNLLAAHVLAYEAIHERQAGAEVTVTLRVSASYERHRLLVDLLAARGLGVERADLDAWLAERRVLHDVAAPPTGPAELVWRRLLAAASPFGPPTPGTGARTARRRPATPAGVASKAVRSALRRPSPRRAVEAVFGGPHPLPLDSVSVAWRPAERRGRRGAGGGAPGGGLAAWCRDQQVFTPGLPVWVEDAVTVPPAADRPRHLRETLGALAAASAEGVPVAGYLYRPLVDGYAYDGAGGRSGLYAMDRSEDGAPRWLDADAAGRDAGGAMRALVAGLRGGDGSVLAGA